MTVRNITPDKQKATALLSRAEEIDQTLAKNTADTAPSFCINNEYDIIHALCIAIMSYDGEKLTRSKDHHKDLLTHICAKYKTTLISGDSHLLDELRKTRNDINYYGQKNKEVLADFYARNKQNVNRIKSTLFKLIRKKLAD